VWKCLLDAYWQLGYHDDTSLGGGKNLIERLLEFNNHAGFQRGKRMLCQELMHCHPWLETPPPPCLLVSLTFTIWPASSHYFYTYQLSYVGKIRNFIYPSLR
jgi:hypothetical protein